MSERLATDLIGYKRSWEGKPKEQVKEEMSSWSLETHRLPDPYTFQVRTDGKFVSPITGELVEKSIERTSHLGKLEGNALDLMQNWARNEDSGLSFWISDPHPDRSEFTKVIISELSKDENDVKSLFNRSLMLQLDMDQAIALHQRLSFAEGTDYQPISPAEIRSVPVFKKSMPMEEWINFLSIEIDDEPLFNKIRTGEDIRDKQIALQNSEIMYAQLFKNAGYDDENVKAAIQHAKDVGFFGVYDSTCPTAFARMFDASAKFVKNCGNCRMSLYKFMKAKDTCDHCGGVYEGC